MSATKPHLNVWKRLAIVLTALGLIGGTLTIHVQTMNQQQAFAMQLETYCLHGLDQLQDQYPETNYTKEREKCASDAVHNATTPSAGQVFRQSFLAACALVAVAWMLFGLMFVTVRWVLRGRTQPGDDIQEIGESR